MHYLKSSSHTLPFLLGMWSAELTDRCSGWWYARVQTFWEPASKPGNSANMAAIPQRISMWRRSELAPARAGSQKVWTHTWGKPSTPWFFVEAKPFNSHSTASSHERRKICILCELLGSDEVIELGHSSFFPCSCPSKNEQPIISHEKLTNSKDHPRLNTCLRNSELWL